MVGNVDVGSFEKHVSDHSRHDNGLPKSGIGPDLHGILSNPKPNVGFGSAKKENPAPNLCERVQKGPVRVRTLEPLILISKNYKKVLDYTTS